MKINVLLAFDHELPLGGVKNSLEESIFEPTYKVLDKAKKADVPVNLFTDVLCAIRMKELGYDHFYEEFINQLDFSIRNGNDVQLHIHPHWLETNFNNNKFEHTNKFKLADFKDNSQFGGIEGIIKKGAEFLIDVCRKADSNYKCIAYRAGGYNLYPETNQILNALYNNGILIESSINPGFYYNSELSYINYKNFPSRSTWFIDKDSPLNYEANNGILEISIAGKPAGIVTNTIHLFRKHLYKNRNFSTGYTIHSGKSNLMNKLKFVFSTRMLGFDLSTITVNDLIEILDYNVKKNKHEEVICLSTLSHPKNMGPYHLQLMEGFIDKARLKYKDDISFTTYQHISDLLHLGKTKN